MKCKLYLSKMNTYFSFLKIFLIGIYTLSYYVTLGLPLGLQHAMLTGMDITIVQYSIIYSVTLWLFFFDWIHAYFIQRWFGMKIGICIYTLLLIFGNVVIGFGGDTKNFWFFVAGRIILGLSGNALEISLSRHFLKCFQVKSTDWLTTLLGGITWLSLSIAFALGSFLYNFVRSLAPPHTSFGITICILTSVLTIVMTSSCLSLAVLHDGEDKQLDLKRKPEVDPKLVHKRKQKRSVACELPASFWLLTLITFGYYASIFAFISVSQVFFMLKYGADTMEAGLISSMLTISGFLMSILVAYLLDVMGRELTFLTIGVATSAMAYPMFFYTNFNPTIPMIAMAFSIGGFAAIWSAFKYCVKSAHDVPINSFRQNAINIGVAVGGLVPGFILNSYGFKGLTDFISIVQLCMVIVTAGLWILNIKYSGYLNETSKQRMKRINVVKVEKKVTVHTIQSAANYGTWLPTYISISSGHSPSSDQHQP